MIDRNSPPMLLNQTEPEPPASVPPTISELRARARQRRRHRRTVAGSLCSVTGISLLAIAMTLVQSRADKDALAPSQTIAGVQPPQESEAAQPSTSGSLVDGIEVFATVSQRIPIFERLPDSQHLYYVGWIDSEGIVPVDLSQFPTEQQQSFKAVLNDTSVPTIHNL